MNQIERSIFIQQAGELWLQATQSKFIDAIADQTLPDEAFQRWLVQDYHFAQGLTSFQAILAAKIQRPVQKLIITGLVAMDCELDWFESAAQSAGYDLNAPIQSTCRRYVDYLLSSAYTQPAEVLLAMLFGVEVSYLYAWSSLKPVGKYEEFIERWSNERFANYVTCLGDYAEENRHPDQQAEFNQVLIFEQEFWQMAWEG